MITPLKDNALYCLPTMSMGDLYIKVQFKELTYSFIPCLSHYVTFCLPKHIQNKYKEVFKKHC